MREHLFPIDLAARFDTDLHQVLEGVRWQLDAQAAEARRADKVELNKCAGESAWRFRRLHARPAPAPWPAGTSDHRG